MLQCVPVTTPFRDPVNKIKKMHKNGKGLICGKGNDVRCLFVLNSVSW